MTESLLKVALSIIPTLILYMMYFYIGDLSLLVLFLQITKLFCFPIFRAYLMKGIPETRRVHLFLS